MPRFLRYLRIAFSATCGIACVLLVVLWVRSYYRCDTIVGDYRNGWKFCVGNCRGRIGFAWIPPYTWNRLWIDPAGNEVFPSQWNSRQIVSRGDYLLSSDGHITLIAHTDVTQVGRVWAPAVQTTLMAPYWMLTLPVATIGALTTLPWIRWRFSLRTLLIATTLVAVVLGIIVWTTRAG